MGFRIIAFLTECLPQHPELSRAPFVQDRSETELVLLRKCLNEVALRIDEVVCNEFVDDGDLLIDSMIAAEMEKEDTEQFESWVNFDEFKKLKQKIFTKLVISYVFRSHYGCRLKKKKRIKLCSILLILFFHT